MTAVNSGGQSIGAGIGLQANVPNVFPEIAQLSAQKQQRQEAQAKADRERAQKAKDLGIGDFIDEFKIGDKQREKLDPTYYGMADRVSHDFISNAWDLYKNSGSPQEFTSRLANLALEANHKFNSLYDASAPLLNLRATDPNKLNPQGQAYQNALNSVGESAENRDELFSKINAIDPKHTAVFKAAGDTTPGFFKNMYVNSGQDAETIAKTLMKDAPLGAPVAQKELYAVPGTNERAIRMISSVGDDVIAGKANVMASDPKYAALRSDYFYGSGAGHYGFNEDGTPNTSQYKDGRVINDPNLIEQGFRDHLKYILKNNAPQKEELLRGSVPEQKEWEYQRQHGLGAFADKSVILPRQSADFSYKAGNGSGENFQQHSDDVRQIPPVDVSLQQNTFGFNENGRPTTIQAGTATKTGQTAVQWVYKVDGKYEILSNDQLQFKKPEDAFPVVMTQVDTPVRETSKDDKTKSETKYEKTWVPTKYVVGFMSSSKDGKPNSTNIATLQDMNSNVNVYYNQLSNKAKEQYDNDFKLIVSTPTSAQSQQQKPASEIKGNVDNSYSE